MMVELDEYWWSMYMAKSEATTIKAVVFASAHTCF